VFRPGLCVPVLLVPKAVFLSSADFYPHKFGGVCPADFAGLCPFRCSRHALVILSDSPWFQGLVRPPPFIVSLFTYFRSDDSPDLSPLLPALFPFRLLDRAFHPLCDCSVGISTTSGFAEISLSHLPSFWPSFSPSIT